MDTLASGNALYDAELRRRIDARRFPRAVVELRSADRVEGTDRYQLNGELTMHGITREVSGTVTAGLPERRTRSSSPASTSSTSGTSTCPAPATMMLKIYPDVRVQLHLEADTEDVSRRGPVGILMAFAVGYAVGAEAGGEGYDELVASFKAVRDSEEFRGLHRRDPLAHRPRPARGRGPAGHRRRPADHGRRGDRPGARRRASAAGEGRGLSGQRLLHLPHLEVAGQARQRVHDEPGRTDQQDPSDHPEHVSLPRPRSLAPRHCARSRVQGEAERGARSRLALAPHPAAVELHVLLHDGQARRPHRACPSPRARAARSARRSARWSGTGMPGTLVADPDLGLGPGPVDESSRRTTAAPRRADLDGRPRGSELRRVR